mgnify:CR=1 FL=1
MATKKKVKRYTLEGVARLLESRKLAVKITQDSGGVVRHYLTVDGVPVCVFQCLAGREHLLVGDGTVLAPLMVRALERV